MERRARIKKQCSILEAWVADADILNHNILNDPTSKYYVSASKDFPTALCQSAFSKHSIDMPEFMVHQSFWIEVCDI